MFIVAMCILVYSMFYDVSVHFIDPQTGRSVMFM